MGRGASLAEDDHSPARNHTFLGLLQKSQTFRQLETTENEGKVQIRCDVVHRTPLRLTRKLRSAHDQRLAATGDWEEEHIRPVPW